MMLDRDEAIALPDPADCIKPGTVSGEVAVHPERIVCKCERHVLIRRASNREYRRRRRGTGRLVGQMWEVGRNALDAQPIIDRLTAAGINVHAGGATATQVAVHPFPEHVKLIRAINDRGWVRLHEADLLCCKVLQLHPALVYGDDWHRLETGESL